jgi:hypothetical protein
MAYLAARIEASVPVTAVTMFDMSGFMLTGPKLLSF